VDGETNIAFASWILEIFCLYIIRLRRSPKSLYLFLSFVFIQMIL